MEACTAGGLFYSILCAKCASLVFSIRCNSPRPCRRTFCCSAAKPRRPRSFVVVAAGQHGDASLLERSADRIERVHRSQRNGDSLGIDGRSRTRCRALGNLSGLIVEGSVLALAVFRMDEDRGRRAGLCWCSRSFADARRRCREFQGEDGGDDNRGAYGCNAKAHGEDTPALAQAACSTRARRLARFGIWHLSSGHAGGYRARARHSGRATTQARRAGLCRVCLVGLSRRHCATSI
jgi:hypothetical protein